MKRTVATLALTLLLVSAASASPTTVTYTDFNGTVTHTHDGSGSGELVIEGQGEKLGQKNTYSDTGDRSFSFDKTQRNASVTFIGETTYTYNETSYSDSFAACFAGSCSANTGSPTSSNNVTSSYNEDNINGKLVLGKYSTDVTDDFEDGDLSEYSGDTDDFYVQNGVLNHTGSDPANYHYLTRSGEQFERGQNFTLDIADPANGIQFDGYYNYNSFQFGQQDTSNYYRVLINSQVGGGEIRLQVGKDGETTRLDQAFYNGNPNELGEMQVNWTQGGQISVNWESPSGTKTLSATNTTYSSGSVSIGSGEYAGTSGYGYPTGDWVVADNLQVEGETITKSQGYWEKTFNDSNTGEFETDPYIQDDVDELSFSETSSGNVDYYLSTNETPETEVSDGDTISASGGEVTLRIEMTRSDSGTSAVDDYEVTATDEIANKTTDPSVDIDGDGTSEASVSGELNDGEQATRSVDAQEDFTLDFSKADGGLDWEYTTYDEGRVYVESVQTGDTTTTVNQYLADGETYTQPISFDAGDRVYGVQTGDNTLTKNVSSMTLNYNTNPQASDDSATTDEDSSVTVDVLANDGDPDGDSVSLSQITNGPSHGTATISNGQIQFDPGTDATSDVSITYEMNDGNGETDTATLSITVNPVNDAPTASDESYTTDEDTTLSVSAPGILSNDADVDGDTLRSTVTSGVSHGTLSLDNDGSLEYTPDSNYNGADSFTYEVSDGKGGTDTATVSLTIDAVNDPPVANDNSYSVDEDNTLSISAPGILANDSDVEGDTLTPTVTSTTSHGSVSLDTDGSFTYTPDTDYNGEDSFTYEVTDGNGGSDTATVDLTVNPFNDAPSLSDQSLTTDEDTEGTIDLSGVATDPDGDSLSFTVTSQPSNGAASIASGTLTYDPDANYNGADSLTVEVSDGNGGTDTATVSITVDSVNDPPSIPDQSLTTEEDTDGTLDLTASDVDGDSLSFTVTSGPSHGTTGISSGTLTYSPDTDYDGSDTLTVEVSDGNGGTDTATLDISVTPVNDPPEITTAPQDASVDEEGSTTFTVDATDVDDDSLSYTWSVSGEGEFESTSGKSVTYDAPDDLSSSATADITVTVDDGSTTVSLTATVTLPTVNDAPTLTLGPNQTVTTTEQQNVTDFATVDPGPLEASQSVLDYNVTVVNGTGVSDVDIVNGELRFTAIDNVTDTVVVEVYAMDDGGTANGGEDTSETKSFNITVDTTESPSDTTNESKNESETPTEDESIVTGDGCDGKRAPGLGCVPQPVWFWGSRAGSAAGLLVGGVRIYQKAT